MIGRSSSVGVRIGIVLAAMTMAASFTGCESGDFVAPPPPAPRGDAGGGARDATARPSSASEPFVGGGTVRSIEMIQARDLGPDETAAERGTAMAQAGYERARLHIRPDEETADAGSPTLRDKPQAELVREAVARKPRVLIVEPEDPADAELARAVGEALAAKVPVVVLGRPIAGVARPDGAARLIVVGPASFAESARRMVELSIRNARNAKLDPQGGAILLVAPATDRFLNERIAAVREALKAAKIAAVDELLIPKQADGGAAVLKKRLLADPKPSMVFTFDFTSTSACNSVASDIIEKRPFIQSGYTSDETLPRMAMAGEFGGLGEFVPARLTQRAVTVAAAVAQGRNVKDKEDVLIPLKESPPTAAAPHIQAARKASYAEREKAKAPSR